MHMQCNAALKMEKIDPAIFYTNLRLRSWEGISETNPRERGQA